MIKALDASCTTDELVRLQRAANDVQIVYEFDDNSKTYNVIIDNLTYDMYILNSDENLYVNYNEGGAKTYGGFLPGKVYNFSFYASSYSPCMYSSIMTKSIYLVPYNKYHEDPLCLGNEEFELCKKFTPIVIRSYEEFKQRIDQYIIDKNKQPTEPEKKPPKVVQSLWDKTVAFFLKYNLYIFSSIIVLGITGIIVIKIRRRKSIL